MPNRQHDFAEYATTAGVEPSGSSYTSAAIPASSNTYLAANYSGYKNPTFDQLANAAEFELNRAKRAPMLAQMQYMWSEELPSIPLFPQVSIEVHKTGLVNWEATGANSYPTFRVGAMYFK